MMSVHAAVLFLLLCSSCSCVHRRHSGTNEDGPALPFKPRSVHAVAKGSPEDEADHLPEYLPVPVSNDRKEDLKPQKGAREVPSWLQKVLLGVPPIIRSAGAEQESDRVGLLCHVDRLYVRVRREIFRSTDAYKYLTLGTCPVNKISKNYFYLLHSLTADCGFKEESFPDYLSISTVLRYDPPGPVLRELPFKILLQCKYYRLFYTYKRGFSTKIQGGTVYKTLNSNGSLTISHQDASGNLIASSTVFRLGDLMYFEANRNVEANPDGQRLYLNKCFVTGSQSPHSKPQHTLIDNRGCMMDGKTSLQSEFIASGSKMVQKFSIGAFLFKGSSSKSPQQFYMHCEMAAGPPTPTPSLKACNYNQTTHRWKELSGEDSVCACCDSVCPSGNPDAAPEMVSTHSWKVSRTSNDALVEADAEKEPEEELKLKRRAFSSYDRKIKD